MTKPTHRKKLIEVALPLNAINMAGAREKSIRHGHPSTLHLWWSRKPHAVARAVLFAQLVDDPSEYTDELLSDPRLKRAAQIELRHRLSASRAAPADMEREAADVTLEEVAADQERERLFELIRELVKWENTNNARLLEQAREKIWLSWHRACTQNIDHPQADELFDRNRLPGFHDPFAGGGALPLEAQRLGLEAYASDLNPVAVLINKAMIEIPPKFAGQPPVNPESRSEPSLLKRSWQGAQGLAEDVRYYGQWMRDEAEKRIGHLYPKVKVTAEMVLERPDLKMYEGQELTVIAWLWARTVKSPNPAFADVEVPLAYTWMLSSKKGKEAYVEPVIEGRTYRFTVKTGPPPDPASAKAGTKIGRGANFRCLLSGSPMSGDHIKAEGKAGRMGARLMAIVAEGTRGRVYLPPNRHHSEVTGLAAARWKPSNELVGKCRDQLPLYGMTAFADLFSLRQLAALSLFSDLVSDAITGVTADATDAQETSSSSGIKAEALAPQEYAQAVGVYLAFALDRSADRGSAICSWDVTRQNVRNTFGRQAIPMVWSFAEVNPFSQSTGNWTAMVGWVYNCIIKFPADNHGFADQADAMGQDISQNKVVSTDPPYYDNIGYADLSDFFYVWLRRALRSSYPDLFSTLAVPKGEELVASRYRHASKLDAETFFLKGMGKALRQLACKAHTGFPITVYYAFKQSETKEGVGTISTGWEAFLKAVIGAGLTITGTWPIRTEMSTRMVGRGANALASSVVLVCRHRSQDAPIASRRQLIADLRDELPAALRLLQSGNIAPVDLAQAAIGPGMEVYTRYAKVLDAAGNPISVRQALALINQILDEVLAEQEGDFDADTRWALTWFDQYGFAKGEFGSAETLAKAKNTSVQGMVDAGIIESKHGFVRLWRPLELPSDWNPESDSRLTLWEALHHLARVLTVSGEVETSALLVKMSGSLEAIRDLCYRLYMICDQKSRPAEAVVYNSLIQSWSEIARLAKSEMGPQLGAFDEQ